jgi:type II secretory pathway component GspD/PulD (secretin)
LIEGDGKVVSAPLVRTFNNQLGIVQQQSQTTIFVPTQTVTQGVINTVFNPIPLTIGTVLAVRPRINNDGYITMTLTPQVEQFGQIRSSPDGSNTAPDIISSSINIATRVKDGETILIAGFNGKQNNTTVTRFPILSDLPIIGSLFRSTSTNRNDSELLIFVTPRVIVEDDDASFTP